MDTTPLGAFTAAIMEQLGDSFDDDATVRTLALLVEIDTGAETTILVACDDDRPWVQVEFLEQGLISLEDRLAMLRDDSELED